MKIAFLCGSLEPGRDGVGDYTRSLAGSCVGSGHSCAMIALRDSHLDSEKERLTGEIPGIRLSPRLPVATRLGYAKTFLADFAPDWVSWQFVSYSYHPKGFIARETRALATLAEGRSTQMMLHELWIGIDHNEPWKNRLIGAIQRRGLLKLLDRLHPRRLHTSNAAYCAVLARHQKRAEILPLFGSIPIALPNPAVVDPFLPRATRESWLIAVTFGTLHPQWQPEATADLLQATATRLGRAPVLLACGRAGEHGPALLQRFTAGRDFAVVITGELTAETISQIFQAADFGIAPHPWALIAKSAAAAAMLDHGLPVLVPRDDWQARPALDLPVARIGLLARLADLTPETMPTWLARRRAPAPSLARIADTFLQSLVRA